MKEPKSTDSFHMILLGIVFDPAKKKILIGKRGKDLYVPKLSWAFPGGRLSHGEDIDKRLKQAIKNKTGYDIKNLGTIFSNIYPEQKDFMAIYFLCEVYKGSPKPGDGFLDLKWVSPDELEKYFTTSFHPHLKEYIMNLK